MLSRPELNETSTTTPSLTSRVPLWVVAASLATAAGIHLAVGYQHDFAGLHGTFFAVAGILQTVAAAVVVRHPTPRFVAVAAVGSSVLLVTWLVERTPGLFGEDALDPLAIGTAVAELVTVVAAIRLLARPVAAPGRIPGIAALGLVALVAVGSGGLADDGHGDQHHRLAEPVVADGTPHEPSSEPGRLRPLPVAPAGKQHHSSPDGRVSDADTAPAPATAPGPGDDHHEDEDASPHDH